MAGVLAGLALTAVALAVDQLTASDAGDGTLSDIWIAASLRTKLAVEQQLQAAQEAARALPQPAKDPKRGVGVAIASPAPWPSGIFETPQAPFTRALYQVANHWQGRIGDEFMQVYAGAKTADPAQGVIVVLTTSAIDLSDRTAQTGGLYLTTEKAGALRIVSANSTRLTVVTSGGKRFVFDVASRALVAL